MFDVNHEFAESYSVLTICYLLGNIILIYIVTKLEILKVVIADKRLAKVIGSKRTIQKRFGQEMAKKITIRVNSLIAAHSLRDFWPPYSGPERCHELKGDLSGYFSFDLKHPYRLLVRPFNEKLIKSSENERDRWNEIKEVVIDKIEDTHA